MKIGVIGGNGVAATNRLCEMVERKVTIRGAFRDAHHPEMVVWQATQAPSRSMFLEGRGPDWRPEYIDIAKKLKAIGCDIGCICCNTAHYALKEIEAASNLPFVNLLDEVVKSARESGHDTFELFCSDGARKFDIYKKSFERFFPDAKLLYPSLEKQKLVTKVICDVKNKLRFTQESDGQSPARLLSVLIETAEAPVILGCTDLRVAFPVEVPSLTHVAVDSLECLADVLVGLNEGKRA